MQAATAKEIREELKTKNEKELMEICLRLSRFKVENKELLTYMLFEQADEQAFVSSIKEEITENFAQLNKSNHYLLKKGVRKSLKETKKHIRYSQEKSTEVELLIHFCKELKGLKRGFNSSTQLKNLYTKQMEMARKALDKLHEDLRYDYELEIEGM